MNDKTIEIPPGAPPRSQWERSASTSWLIELMRKTPIGDTLTYDVLSSCARVDDIRQHRGYIFTAIKALVREGICYSSVRNVGYCRMSDAEKLGGMKKHIDASRRRSKDAINIGSATDVTKLTQDERAIHTQRYTVATLAVGILSPKGQKQLREATAVGPDIHGLLGDLKK